MAWEFDAVAAQVAAGQTIQDTHIEAVSADTKTYGGNVDANGHKLVNLATPTSGGDAANKDYVDGVAGGDVSGPSSSVHNQVAIYNGTSGKLLAASAATIGTSGDATFPGLTYTQGGLLLPRGTTLPATGYVGEIFIKTDEAADEQIFICVDDSPITWQQYNGTGGGGSYDPLDRTWIYLVDEFMGGQVANGFGVGIGELGWNSTGTTGAATYTDANSILGHPGSLRDLRTGATSTNTAYLTLGGGGSNLTTILGTQLHTYSGWSMEFELRTHASDIANIYIGAGFYGDANLTDAFANTDSRIAIEFSTAQSDTEWMLAVYHSGTGTRTATGVTVAANTYYRLKIEGDNTGSVRAIIDGGTPTSSVTSNLPTASGHIAFAVQTHTSATKYLYYDRFAAKIKRQ